MTARGSKAMRATLLFLGVLIAFLALPQANAQTAASSRGQVSFLCARMVCYYNTRQPPPNKWASCPIFAPEGVPCYCFIPKFTGTVGCSSLSSLYLASRPNPNHEDLSWLREWRAP